MRQVISKNPAQEASGGRLRGPVPARDLDKRLGCWLPNRRFGIKQAGKLRVIDDYAASLVNDGLAAVEAVAPDDLDVIALNLRAHMQAFSCGDWIERKDGHGWDRHPDFVGSELVAKLWDLEAAYRQLARSPAHASFTVVAVWSPDADEHVYFEQPVLAFGATTSSALSIFSPWT